MREYDFAQLFGWKVSTLYKRQLLRDVKLCGSFVITCCWRRLFKYDSKGPCLHLRDAGYGIRDQSEVSNGLSLDKASEHDRVESSSPLNYLVTIHVLNPYHASHQELLFLK